MSHLPFVEERWTNFTVQYRVNSVLHTQQTDFQYMMLVDSEMYGKMLLLDGVDH